MVGAKDGMQLPKREPPKVAGGQGVDGVNAGRSAEAGVREPPQAGRKVPSASTDGADAGGDSASGGYEPVKEAIQAGEHAAESLGEVSSALEQNEVLREGAEQSADLAGAIVDLTDAVGTLSRIVAALIEELKAGRGGGSLPAVAMLQKPVAENAAEEALSVAQDDRVKAALLKIFQKLKRAVHWLWSMVIQLLTIREWSLGGKVKMPGLAEASVTVVFGG